MNLHAWNITTGWAAIAASLPLLAWAWGMIRGKTSEKEISIVSILMIGGSFLISAWALVQVWEGDVFRTNGVWIDVGSASSGLRLTWGIRLDFLAAAMLTMVSGIALLVHVFSTEYLQKDSAFTRYFTHLGFFCSAMMWLVLADNLMMMFVCWELVGLASWLLIGFWREQPAPGNAAQKAFIVNRIADAGFLIGIMILLAGTGTLDLVDLPNHITELSPGWQTAAALCLFIGAAGKSAQFPFQGWLPDAMEGPTPVSSLIHAATMVAAGVYLLGRIAFLIPPQAGMVIAFIGAITALMAAISAMTQWDIKRVLAYSTISQLGYMVMGIGVGARDMALLHLFTHAFFKCALFLSAGAVIHAIHGQDMRQMGGLRTKLPKIFYAYLPPMLALAGLPFFSGFLSKDGILLGAMNWANMTGGLSWLVPMMGFAAAGLTAYYMGRHAWLIFFRPASDPSPSAIHRPGARIWMPLMILAVMSCWLPFSMNPFEGAHSWLVEGIGRVAGMEKFHLVTIGLSLLMVMGGLGLAWWRRNQFLEPEKSAETLLHKLSFQHFYWDQLYERVIAVSVFKIGQIAQFIDKKVIDGGIDAFGWLAVHKGPSPSLSSLASNIDDTLIDGFVNGIANGVIRLGRVVRRTNSGGVQQTLWLAMVIMLLIAGGIWVFS